MNQDLHRRLALFSNLDCRIARRFNDRPTLLDAADHMLIERWQHHQLDISLDPLSLNLASQRAEPGKAWVRPLAQLLVERYCRRQTLNLTPGEDFVTSHLDADSGWAVDVDLHELERLINQAGPLLLKTYRSLLVAYWSRFDSSGETPWHWYAHYLREQLQATIDASGKDARLPHFALAAAKLVHDYPSAYQRRAWPNTADHLDVTVLGVDFSLDGKLDVDLASALLIEHADGEPTRDLLLLYTLGGKLLRFASRRALAQAIGRYWPVAGLSAPRQLSLAPSYRQDFESQALGLFQRQLQVIEHLAGQYHSELDAIALSLDLDRFTSMIDLCSEDEANQRQRLFRQLPDWLRNAPSRPLMHYSTLLIDIAQTYDNANGQFWLDGIDTAEAFANRQLAARFAADHPLQPLDPRQVRVINHQTTAAAAAGQGVVFVSGGVTPVEFSLAQLAIGNLGLLKPGRVELSASAQADPGSGAPTNQLPVWMTEAYLHEVISDLDIATAYPTMLRAKLLDDAAQRPQRQQLLAAQLRTQLPALAMELFLRGELPDRAVVDHIAEVFATLDSAGPAHWILRPLGFIKAPGSAPDHPGNTWLFEPEVPSASPCLLYRPLHKAPLLYFVDRLALFSAISTPGELQDDLLQRLPAQDRRFYAHGGFLEPHLFVPLDDTSAIPLSTPPPISLAQEAPLAEPAQALYLACVNESIERFSAHAASTAETRWNNWKHLGWLLFNTLLPLAGSTLGKVAWLAQIELALVDYVQSDSERDPSGHRLAMVNLLVNIAMLLFSHSIFRLRLEQAEPAVPSRAPTTIPAAPAVQTPAHTLLNTTVAEQLEFSWARPDRKLDARQRSTLETLQATLSVSELGAPVPSGPLRGLYLQGDKLYVVLDDKAYQATLDTERDQMRITGPEQSPGPWLHHDEIGRWQLDLRLALKGGMPLSAQLRKLQLQKATAMQAANDLIKADKEAISARNLEMTTVEKLASSTEDDSVLATCQAKINTLSSFWTSHLEHLKARNALSPVKSFKTVHAYALYQDSYCQRVQHSILRKRYQPAREQLLQIARQQPDGYEMTAADIRIAGQRLETLVPLLDDMIENNQKLRQCQDELGKLASQRQPDIMQWRNLAASVSATAEDELILRFLRLECLLNRLAMVHGLSNDGLYWRERFWTHFELGIAQRARLFKLGRAEEEVAIRLLQSIREHLRTARRLLEHLVEYAEADAAQQTVRHMQQELDGILGQIDRDLAELPDYPPVSNLHQLRSKMPGLIETSDHGLLLGEPREDDANTVEVAGPDNKSPGRLYHLKQGAWVELSQTRPTASATPRSLKRLLKESDALKAEAGHEMRKLQNASDRYLPVELEEVTLHHRDRLLAQADAIEQRLTEANQTDDARQGQDAELVAAALRQQATQLAADATALRVAAALRQKPRMAEVQFLLGKEQVRISRVGSRTRLTRVKGRPDDFLDEYSISHAGSVLWYAHFHYPALGTAKADFTAGHLKTAAQRHSAGQRYTDTIGNSVEVYRAPITGAAAGQYFFNL